MNDHRNQIKRDLPNTGMSSSTSTMILPDRNCPGKRSFLSVKWDCIHKNISQLFTQLISPHGHLN